MKYGRKILPNHPDLVNLMILRERERKRVTFLKGYLIILMKLTFTTNDIPTIVSNKILGNGMTTSIILKHGDVD